MTTGPLIGGTAGVMLGFVDFFLKRGSAGRGTLTAMTVVYLIPLLLWVPFVLLLPQFGIWSLWKAQSAFAVYAAVRSVLLILAYGLAIISLRDIPLSQAVLVRAIAPAVPLIVGLCVEGLQLRSMGWFGMLCVLLSYAAVYLGAHRAHGSGSRRALLIAGMSAVLSGIVVVLDRTLLRAQPSETVLSVQVWSDVLRAIILIALLPMARKLLPQQPKETPRAGWIGYLVLAGVFITIGESLFLVFLALDSSQMSTASLFRRLSLVVSFLIGMAVLRERPTRVNIYASLLSLIGILALSVDSLT